jgi:hypothetical protein
MVTRTRTGILVAVVATAALGGYVWWRGGEEPAATTVPGERDSRAARAPLPRIALERLDRRPESSAGASRDIFGFGRPEPPALVAPPSTAPQGNRASTPAAPPEAATPATPAPPPPFAVRYVGTVERQGLKVAVLLSEDKKEILTGREGDTVANRLRIVKIGLESVEVLDVGSERTRRIPLRGN